ncbi:hypothetical protein CYY_000353 [Polysphondylium violaceum]|uniref:3'-5' exonuclease domain-containing protein n=1 Tax=Polysphondylium violaceum TaxID=133409 RepID=A0A8J4Q4Z3_9MYCE|nr:hypothetical protein CYY_000353 [Polysphondylium violaceum]
MYNSGISTLLHMKDNPKTSSKIIHQLVGQHFLKTPLYPIQYSFLSLNQNSLFNNTSNHHHDPLFLSRHCLVPNHHYSSLSTSSHHNLEDNNFFNPNYLNSNNNQKDHFGTKSKSFNSENSIQFLPNHVCNTYHKYTSAFSEDPKNFQHKNCVKFESNKCNYVYELVEGILPKEIVFDSTICVSQKEPHSVFLNFSTPVKAYQANQYMQEWNQQNEPHIKPLLMKKSLDPLYAIDIMEIENMKEYPVPEFTFVNSPQDASIINILLNGKEIKNIQAEDNITISLDYEWYHPDPKDPDSQKLMLVSFSNQTHTLIFNLLSLDQLPKPVIDVLLSDTIKKVGFNHKSCIGRLEQQFNVKVNSFEDISKFPIVLRSKPKTLIAMVGLFLHKKLPRIEINRFDDPNHIFTTKKIQHYAQKADAIAYLYPLIKGTKADFHLSLEDGECSQEDE